MFQALSGPTACWAGLLCAPHGCSGRCRARPPAGPGYFACPWAAARPRAVRAAILKARRVVSKPGQAPPPPTGTAARPSSSSGTLHTSGAWSLMHGSVHRLEARPGPATAHGHRSQALRSLRRPPHLWGQRPHTVCSQRNLPRPRASGARPPSPDVTANVFIGLA